MRWFRSKYQGMAEELADEVNSLNSQLEVERTRRIAAESLAAERLKQVEKAYESAFRAEAARDEAVKARLTSLDLVNTTLLGAVGPERPPPDPKTFTQSMQNLPPRKKQVLAARKQADMRDMKVLLHPRSAAPGPATTPSSTEPPVN